MIVSRVVVAILVLAAIAVPVFAHHSLSAEFDDSKQVKLTGTVATVDWMNPHTYVFVDVKDPSVGKIRSWACQLSSPQDLTRRGFTRSSLKVGMAVTVVGTRAKDGSFKIHTESLTADNSILLKK